MIDLDTAPAYLVRRGLLDRGWILDDRLTIRALDRRNSHLRVEGPGGRGLLIKQPGADEDSSLATLRCEAAFHRFCRETPAMAAVAGHMAALVADDPGEGLLIFEIIAGASPLHPLSTHWRTESVALDLGRSLGRLHIATREVARRRSERPDWLDRGLPWILGIHEPRPDLLADLNPGHMEVLRILQAPGGLHQDFAALRLRWQPDCVIHGDIRLDNLLLGPALDGEESRAQRLWIVDWEMVGIGDPAWDLAGLLQELLVAWVVSMPMTDGQDLEQMVAQATMPRDVLQSLARSVWAGYREEAGLSPGEAAALLGRAVAFSAGRLVQTVFEGIDRAGGLAGPSVFLLQIAANSLAEPWRAQAQLFGIPLDGFGT